VTVSSCFYRNILWNKCHTSIFDHLCVCVCVCMCVYVCVCVCVYMCVYVSTIIELTESTGLTCALSYRLFVVGQRLTILVVVLPFRARDNVRLLSVILPFRANVALLAVVVRASCCNHSCCNDTCAMCQDQIIAPVVGG
jgi:hypothetical protein